MANKKNSDRELLCILTHILGMFFSFIAPLVIYLSSKDKIVKKHSKKAMNWQFSFLIYSVISFILVFVLIGIPLLFILSILNIVFPIIATVKVTQNEIWNYPLAIPFFK